MQNLKCPKCSHEFQGTYHKFTRCPKCNASVVEVKNKMADVPQTKQTLMVDGAQVAHTDAIETAQVATAEPTIQDDSAMKQAEAAPELVASEEAEACEDTAAAESAGSDE